MSFQKAIFISLGVGSALVLGGCGAKDTNPEGTGGAAGAVIGAGGVAPGSGGTPGVAGTTVATAGTTGAAGTTGTAGTTGAAGAGTGGPGTTCADTNLMGYTPNAMPISFTTDILPMFGLSCVTSDCHNSNEQAPRAGLQLGHKCAYDATAKWKCTFPTTAPSDPTQPAPDDPTTVMAVYQSLMAPAETVMGAGMARVKPGDPYNSFLMLKLSDEENSRGLTCTNTDASHETNPGPCGVNMPQGSDPWCSGSDRAKFDAIGQWIANGAPMN
ncbi:MAG TPA: hypothetical protein VHC69_35495 [Polyangiaceae bacterium]|nr:hypothetical protein [Polyangiaceae bacterium]